MNNKLPQIQAKIREVCPETVDYHPGDRLRTTPGYRTLELPHVLRAIGEKRMIEAATSNGKLLWLSYHDSEGKVYQDFWDLAHPLHLQKESLINFLFTILCP